jgi:hypothetical protein
VTSYRDTAEAGWAWVLEQPRPSEPGVHSGWGGLGLALAEVRRARPWTPAEESLAAEVVAAVRADVEATVDASWFDGLPGHLEVLTALGAAGRSRVVGRLLELATPTGWPTTAAGPPRFAPDVRINDATLGTAGVLRAGVAACADGVPGAADLVDHAAGIVLAEVDQDEHGPFWHYVPRRFRAEDDPATEMPNWSHGAAGVATALAEAGAATGRPDWVDLARRAAERLVAIGDHGDGLKVRHTIPQAPGHPPFAYGWCHGPSGTQQVFGALERAGVTEVAGEPPATWRERCWDAVVAAGVPDRGEPGHWDNDGRCCGTAGVGDLALTAGRLDLAARCADALVERAVRDGEGDLACWRFVEHRNVDPLLPPDPGWMQGAAGISAFLFRYDRSLTPGGPAVATT